MGEKVIRLVRRGEVGVEVRVENWVRWRVCKHRGDGEDTRLWMECSREGRSKEIRPGKGRMDGV